MPARKEQAVRAVLIAAQFTDIVGSVERIFFAATVQGVPSIVSLVQSTDKGAPLSVWAVRLTT